MSPESPERRKAAFRSAFTARPSVIPPKYPEISSLLTTVRLLSDRSRPPQVGPTGHTCTASADRTAPAKTFRAPQPRNRCRFPSPACLRQRALLPHSRPPRAKPSAETGGSGGNYFPRRGPGQRPASPACCLPLNPGAAPRCSGRSPSTQCGDSSLLSAWFSLHAVPSLFVYPTCHFF